MVMHLIISVLFAITVLLAFMEDRLKETHKLIILAMYAIVMVTMATVKDIEHTADAENYVLMFYNNDDPLVEIATEPTYIHLSRIVLACGGTIAVMFFIYAIIAIPTKLKTLSKLTPYVFTALTIYIPVYFELHDMVQIRVAAAAAFLLASLIPLAKKQYLQATLLMTGGIMFHYSAASFLPFLFIGNRKLNQSLRIALAVAVPACFVLYLMKKDMFSLIPASLTEGKLDFYQQSSERGAWGELTILYKNVYFLVKCAMLYLCLYFYDYIVKRQPLAPLLINLFASSILFLMLMSTIPVVASRISDLYGIVDCIVFTFCLYVIKPLPLAKAGIVAIGFYMLIYNMIAAEYFT